MAPRSESEHRVSRRADFARFPPPAGRLAPSPFGHSGPLAGRRAPPRGYPPMPSRRSTGRRYQVNHSCPPVIASRIPPPLRARDHILPTPQARSMRTNGTPASGASLAPEAHILNRAVSGSPGPLHAVLGSQTKDSRDDAIFLASNHTRSSSRSPPSWPAA
jgi:hypothetical protein